jgi:outer membrane lipoprotein SlyB
MKRKHRIFIAGLVAVIWPLSTPAQEYRYPSPEDTARQNAQQSAPSQSQPAPGQAAPPVYAQQQQAQPQYHCRDCGTIDTIRTSERAGEASGVGMIAGGLLGGLLGHQVGSGRGNTAATIVGAAGGAFAGNAVEKNYKKVLRYDVVVRMDDGTFRTVNYDVEPGFRAGDKVRFVEGRLTRI